MNTPIARSSGLNPFEFRAGIYSALAEKLKLINNLLGALPKLCGQCKANSF